MKVRVVVAVLLALAVGVGGGYAVATSQEVDAPGPVAPQAGTVSPLPASPRLPVAEIKRDRDDPTLLPGIDLVPQTLEVPGDKAAGVPTYTVTMPTPADWGRRFDGLAKWTYTVDGTDSYPYGLRVQLIADQEVSVATAVRSRTSALESAEAQSNLTDLEVVPNSTGDGFASSYVADGFRVVGLERFYVGDDPSRVFATVAAYGRTQDREGLVDLLALVSQGLRTQVQPAQ